MGTELARALLLWLPLLLQRLGSQELSCAVFSGDPDWSRQFNATCLNFSGRLLRLPRDQPLRAPNLRLLDLAGTGLRELPPPFLAPLRELRVLDVLHNRLDSVDAALAARCDLDLRADCSCALAPWHWTRRDNCSGREPLRCLRRAAGAWQNLSAFLEAGCAPGPHPATLGGAAAGGVLLLALTAAGALLAWRRRGRRAAGSRHPGKSWGPRDGASPGAVVQTRYSSRSSGLKAPAATAAATGAPDYENIFVGPPEVGHEWPDHRWVTQRRGPVVVKSLCACRACWCAPVVAATCGGRGRRA